MTQSLFSSNWHRVAQLQIRLREGVVVKRQFWRGELWFLLNDEVSGNMHRINMQAYQFIGRCDGNLTVQHIWDALLLDKEDAAPTQDEVIELISRLNQLSLLYTVQDTDVSSLFERRKAKRSQDQSAHMNPFAIRIPLGDPSKWLNQLDDLAALIFKPAMLWLWLTCITIACLVASSEWAALMAHAKMHMLTPRYLTITLLCFPIIKALHELCHGLAVRHWEGSVHEFGISLLVFVPAPYVDASSANAFSLRSQRMAVSAAGIMLEMLIAALGLFVWLNVQAGLVQDIAFACMVIGSISTLVFNGNPLLRFDGYYVLSDYLDIPNLATRSHLYWQAIMKGILTFQYTQPFELTQGEKKWLILYNPLSFAYKCAISVFIILWLGSQWFLIGTIAAIYMGITIIIKPLFKSVSQLLDNTAPGKDLSTVKRNLMMLSISMVTAVFMIPLPFSTVTPAVVWMPEKAQVRPEENGFIKALPVKSGQAVKQGDVLAIIDNPKLTKQREKLTSKLDGLKADQFQLLITNPVEAENINQQIHNVEQQLKRIDVQIAHLTIKAEIDGQFIMPKQQDKVDAYIHRGDLIAYIFQDSAIKVRAVVPEKDAYMVRNQSNDIAIWLADQHQLDGTVNMAMEIPSATRQLPSAALGDQAGGPFVTDPTDDAGTKLLEPVFLFDLTVSDTKIKQVGGTAYVKFQHDAMPLASQVYHRANQLLMKSFEPRT